MTDATGSVDGWATDHVATAFPLYRGRAHRVVKLLNRGRPNVVLAPLGPTSLAHRRLLSSVKAPLAGLVLQYPYRFRQIPWEEMVDRGTLEQGWLVGLGAVFPDPVKGWALDAGDGLVATTRATQRRLLELGVPTEAILYAPPGLDRDAFRRPSDPPASSGPRILYFGNCLRIRGIDRVLDVFQLLRRHHPDLELVILDRGDGGFDVRGELSRRGTPQNVTLVRGELGQEALRTWLASATLVLLPFRLAVQDAPLTLLEAQALGVPVVTTEVPGVAELVESPGAVVDSGEPSALAEAVEDLLALHPVPVSLRDSLARRIRERTPTWEETALAVGALLEELAPG